MQFMCFANAPLRRNSIVCRLAVPFVLVSMLLYGCGRSTDAQRVATSNDESALDAASDQPALHTAQQPVPSIQIISTADAGGGDAATTIVDARPVALIDARPVTWGELRESLTEAAGAQALREVILERGLGTLLADRGIAISEDAIAAERTLFITSLDADPNVALRLLDELRKRQGLGATRFRKLLWQNAALRALVADRVQVTDDAVQRMFDLVHGPKRQARLIMVPNLAEAERVLARVEIGEAFSDIAVEVSTDASAARGGLLEPISRNDETYPAAVREALWQLELVPADSPGSSPGNVSNPILLDTGYAIVKLERKFAADDVQLADVRAEMERLVKINQERTLMDQLARTILRGANVTVIDAALSDSWQRDGGPLP